VQDLRPSAVDGLITFLYYDDLDKAEEFYRGIMGFELIVDQGWAKILKVTGKAHVGLVDGNTGYHRASPTKPVMITVVVQDVDRWYEHMRKLGIETLTEPRDNEELGLRMFLLEDPEGYIIEIQKFC
jgi:predicted enzyme related to lactoylglutathione lyase